MDNMNARACVNDAISQLQLLVDTQSRLDNAYDMFRNAVVNEMDLKLEKRVVVIKEGTSNKKRKIRKPWWTEQLTRLWNKSCEAEKAWRVGTTKNKERLKAAMRASLKDFDKCSQASKRRYWQEQQNKLMNMYGGDTKSFWKHRPVWCEPKT